MIHNPNPISVARKPMHIYQYKKQLMTVTFFSPLSLCFSRLLPLSTQLRLLQANSLLETKPQFEASEAQYAEFEEKVKRTVYLDNLSPQVNESIVKQALDQFGNVKSVQFIPNYLESKNVPQCALIEMENPTEVNAIVSDIAQKPFMIGGMPRPVRARKAKMEMFDDRPVKPGRTIQFRWLEPNDPDFEVAKKLKELAKIHSVEAEYVLKKQLEDEEKLEKQHQESLKATHTKYKMIDSVIADGTTRQLARGYHLRVADD